MPSGVAASPIGRVWVIEVAVIWAVGGVRVSDVVGSGAKERFEWGNSLRETVPLASHAEWNPSPSRDPVGLVLGQDEGRLQSLVPVRHQRMGASAFAFYRGSAIAMAADLATTPASGIQAQLCGDAHLSNFGLYGSPERRLVFDVNDFDETLPGPWEWDLKRLAASFVLAARDLGFSDKAGRKAARDAARTYREAMATFSSMRYLDIWYAQVDVDSIQQDMIAAGKKEKKTKKKTKKKSNKTLDKARSKDSLKALRKLAVEVDGKYRIEPDPPFIVPLSDLQSDLHSDQDPDQIKADLEQAMDVYYATLSASTATLAGHYRMQDFALKVVGVGSVGTRSFMALMEGRDQDDPLFLQVKEADRSVLEAYLEPSAYPHSGQRVVEGQRLMQASSDIFLGWTQAKTGDRHYYMRQMWDMKGSADVDSFDPKELRSYGRACGWTLAHAHARSGSATSTAGYLGDDDTFDSAIAAFAQAYADQIDVDYKAFMEAVNEGS